MTHSKAALTLYEGIEIPERDWLICGLLWIAIGMLALSPFDVLARTGRVIFALTLCVHTVEATYVALRAAAAGFNAQKRFLRTIVLGSFALLIIEFHLRKEPRRRSVR